MDFNVNNLATIEQDLQERMQAVEGKLYLWNQISVKTNPDGSLRKYKVLSKNFDNCSISNDKYSNCLEKKSIDVAGYYKDKFYSDSIYIYDGDYTNGFRTFTVEEVCNAINDRKLALEKCIDRYKKESPLIKKELVDLQEKVYKLLDDIKERNPDLVDIHYAAQQLLNKKYWG